MAQAQYIATGRRKNSTARERLVPGTGKIIMNKKDITEYIPFPYFCILILKLVSNHQITNQIIKMPN